MWIIIFSIGNYSKVFMIAKNMELFQKNVEILNLFTQILLTTQTISKYTTILIVNYS